MKQYVFVLLVSIMAMSCSSMGEETKIVDPYETDYGGYLTASLNGEPWRASVRSAQYEVSALDSSQYPYKNAPALIAGNSFKEVGPNHLVNSGAIVVGYLVGDDYPYTLSLVDREYSGANDYDHIVGSRFVESDDDVIMARFNLYGYDNFIRITSVDTSANIVEGEFNVTFVFDTGIGPGHELYHLRYYPDTLRFTNGRFRVRQEQAVLQASPGSF